MAALSSFWLVISLPFLVLQGLVQDPVRAQYSDAMAAADGLPALVRRLDAIATGAADSPSLPKILETIQVIAAVYPGSVPDQDARLQAMKSSAAANQEMARSARRIELLQAYYAAASKGRPEQGVAFLSDPVFEGWLPVLHARADASLRTGDYRQAETFAQQLIEADSFSPLLADAHLVLGFCYMSRNQVPAAAREFQRALVLTPLPTRYGSARDFATLAYRFARPVPGAIAGVFEEAVVTRIAGIPGLDDPQSLRFQDGKFVLTDRDQVYTITGDGKATAAKVARKLSDLAFSPSGSACPMAEDSLDPGSGNWIKLTYTASGRVKSLGKLLSLDIDSRGDFYLLDQDAGVLRGVSSGSGLSLTPVIPMKGHLLRIDSRDNLYVLGWDRRSISILSRDGKALATLSPAPWGGRSPSIEYFAVDSLNHAYILDTGSNSIQIFALNPGAAGLEVAPVATLALDPRPYHKNLRVLAVSDSGEIVVTGKNEDNWVLYR
jgi:tetratricopeptide (TPR) repeat protein